MKLFRKSTVLLLTASMILCLCTPLTALAEGITVDDVLRHLEDGTATEIFEEHAFCELSATEIAADPILEKMIMQIKAAENTINSNARVDHDTTIYGSYFTDTITDSTGATVKYYLAPRIYVEYGDIPRYGNSNWHTKLYVHEYITLNGIEQEGYINRIKLKNITGAVGAGPDVRFSSNVYIKKQTDTAPNITVNALGILSAVLSLTQYQTAAAVTSALASISYNSGSNGYSINATNKNLVGAEFESGVIIDDSYDTLSIDCTLGTASSATVQNATCYFSVRWSFDVYKGSTKHQSYVMKKEGSVLGNAA